MLAANLLLLVIFSLQETERNYDIHIEPVPDSTLYCIIVTWCFKPLSLQRGTGRSIISNNLIVSTIIVSRLLASGYVLFQMIIYLLEGLKQKGIMITLLYKLPYCIDLLLILNVPWLNVLFQTILYLKGIMITVLYTLPYCIHLLSTIVFWFCSVSNDPFIFESS